MAGNGITAQEAIAAIEGSRGFVTVVAKRLACSRTHVYRLLEKYATVAEALEDEREAQKDRTESKLYEAIDDGQLGAIIFYLKTQAKERGYIERQELTGKDGGDLHVRVEYVNRPPGYLGFGDDDG